MKYLSKLFFVVYLIITKRKRANELAKYSSTGSNSEQRKLLWVEYAVMENGKIIGAYFNLIKIHGSMVMSRIKTRLRNSKEEDKFATLSMREKQEAAY
ncbi:CLUMA_CG008753, isoform A [Clunio marinus]|uniref:CLUMA_CG008753, isoform A n=1 Tax=Clunio marinus TaxID=568069 RepID=A0A1J1I9R7_9DIPT|nr:CLUMA_CG008753, isoform A [Clunio marinus]